MRKQLYLIFQLSTLVIFFSIHLTLASLMLDDLEKLVQTMKQEGKVSLKTLDLLECWLEGLNAEDFFATADTCLMKRNGEAIQYKYHTIMKSDGRAYETIGRIYGEDNLLPKDKKCLGDTYLDFLRNAQLRMIAAYPQLVTPPTPIPDKVWRKFEACTPHIPVEQLSGLRNEVEAVNKIYLDGMNKAMVHTFNDGGVTNHGFIPPPVVGQ